MLWLSPNEFEVTAALLVVLPTGEAAVSQIAAADAQTYIAGTAPDRRPENAPKIETFEKSPQWLESATTGVTKPIPPSLKFLDDQGGWFTPFTHPGMTGPYDIRGWHAARANGAPQKIDQGH